MPRKEILEYLRTKDILIMKVITLYTMIKLPQHFDSSGIFWFFEFVSVLRLIIMSKIDQNVDSWEIFARVGTTKG